MAATLELKYFNSFWLKKLRSITSVRDTTGTVNGATFGVPTIVLSASNPLIGVGQRVRGSGISATEPFVTGVSGSTITVSSNQTIADTTVLEFGPIVDFTYIPAAYGEDIDVDWVIEEARIRGGYNNTITDLGAKAYVEEDKINQKYLPNHIIYSGLYNPKTNINNTNQFPTGEDITRSVDPSNGSIQKLYAEDTNLTIFQESKVSRALIDKQAVYSADGQAMTTSGNLVIGQIQAYAGNYGISRDPESFAVYGYRKYFTDKSQNAVLRLSQDGITEISAYGLTDYFRDLFFNTGDNSKIVGMWDMHNKQYVLSVQPSVNKIGQGTTVDNYATLAFDEDSNGWTSRYSYRPEFGGSLKNNFYTFKSGGIWKHYSDTVNNSSFYGTISPSSITFVFNDAPSTVKNFSTINYEGGIGWEMISMYTDTDNAAAIAEYSQVNSIGVMEAQLFSNNFKKKENKYFANLMNITQIGQGDVIYGQSMSGLKGFYATVQFSLDNSLYGSPGTRTEIFASSTNYSNSSY
jgi:hypothetical protein